MKNITSILLVVTAIALFSYYIDPTYKEIGTLRAQEAEFAEALENTEKVQDLRNELQTKYNSFSQEDREKLEKLLPDSVDNVRLIIEIDAIASRHNMEFENVQTTDTRSRSAPSPIASGAIGAEAQRRYAESPLSFTVLGEYDDFLNFLRDIERSLRIMDITNVEVDPEGESGKYAYDIKLRTYWLPPLTVETMDPAQYIQ